MFLPGQVGSVSGEPPCGEAAHYGGWVVCGRGHGRRVCQFDSPQFSPTLPPVVGGAAHSPTPYGVLPCDVAPSLG